MSLSPSLRLSAHARIRTASVQDLRMARLFVAAWAPEDVVRQVDALAAPSMRGVRWVKPYRLHFTLRFLGEADPGEAIEALAGAVLPAAQAKMGSHPELLGRGVLAVPVDGLDELSHAVTDATRFIGQPPQDRPFFGHMTVARYRRNLRRLPSVDWPPLDELFPDAFPVTEAALVESTPWSAYATVERFSLAWPEHDR